MPTFATDPDAQAPQQPARRLHHHHHHHPHNHPHNHHHTSRPRSNTMNALDSNGIDIQTCIGLQSYLGQTTSLHWTPGPYSVEAEIMRQALSPSLGEGPGPGLKDCYDTRAGHGLGFHGNYSTSSLQQSAVNGTTDAPLFYPSPSPISRPQPQHAYDCIDPDLQTSTLLHHNPSSYSTYGGTHAISQPVSVHNSPTLTPAHNNGSITVPATPPGLPRSNLNMPFRQQIATQRTAVHSRDPESETESQKSTSDVGNKNRAFLRKGRSGTVYTVCPKQLYKCLYDPNCRVIKHKACDMKDHYYSIHAQFNCIQCGTCGSSYARPCTYKRHLKDDKTCPKPHALTTQQLEQGRLRKEIMECFADMTNERLVKKGVMLMKKCNTRLDMRKRKRRQGCSRKPDLDEADEEDVKSAEPPVTDCAETGSQFTAVNNVFHPHYFSQQLSPYPYQDPNPLFEFSGHNAGQSITPRNFNNDMFYLDQM